MSPILIRPSSNFVHLPPPLSPFSQSRSHLSRPFLSSPLHFSSFLLNPSNSLFSSAKTTTFALETSRVPAMSTTLTIKLPVIEATPTSFEEFGQLIEASPDGDEFGPRDAQLDLSRGIPRFYIMHLEDRPFQFFEITHHAKVTQCLGSIGGHVWYLGVAKASIVNPPEIHTDTNKKIAQSRWGHYYVPPVPDDVRVFRISGPKFIKLHTGTWHAGPLFEANTMDFYNLELSNTNVVDHTPHNFKKEDGVVFSFDG